MNSSSAPELIIERVFDAPRELVWQAWTDPKMAVAVGRPAQPSRHAF